MCGVNYDELRENLIHIDRFQIYKDIRNLKDAFIQRNTHTSTNNFYAEQADIKNLAAQLVFYYRIVYKNFNFVDFYDKMFIDTTKTMIKDEEEFRKFLDMVDLDPKTFIKLMVYISPQVFTTNLVKFIRKQYLDEGHDSQNTNN